MMQKAAIELAYCKPLMQAVIQLLWAKKSKGFITMIKHFLKCSLAYPAIWKSCFIYLMTPTYPSSMNLEDVKKEIDISGIFTWKMSICQGNLVS